MKCKDIVNNQDFIQYYLGSIYQSYYGYTYNNAGRKQAASGGLTTELLRFCLKKKIIQGAIVCRLIFHDGELKEEVCIVQNPDDLYQYSGSFYAPVSIAKYISLIRSFDGKIAIVGLPCQINTINKIIANDSLLSSKIVLKIGLFCGHNSKKELLLQVLKKKNIDLTQVKRFSFRRGHWRGRMHIELSDGKISTFPFSDFGLYQNIHILAEKKCVYCFDHTCESSDISFGDAWLPFLKDDPIKHSIAICRNEMTNSLLENMRREGEIFLTKIESEIVFKSQKRALIFHKAREARIKVAKKFGISIRGSFNQFPARWNEILAAYIVMLSYYFSNKPTFKKLIFMLPKGLLYSILGVFKLLTNF